MMLDPDGAPTELFGREKVVYVRKQQTCQLCGGAILPGEKVVKSDCMTSDHSPLTIIYGSGANLC